MSGSPQQEVMSLTAASQARQQAHEAVQEQLEIQSVAATLVVPTLPAQVRETLRSYGQPVRLFGENLANVRDRLRILLATLQVRGIVKAEDGSLITIKQEAAAAAVQAAEYDDTEEEVTKYTRGDLELLQARQKIAEFSLRRAAERLAREAKLREGARLVRKRKKEPELKEEKENTNVTQWNTIQQEGFCIRQRVKDLVLEASQYADSRSLSAVCAVNYGNHQLVACGGWTASVKFWDASSLSEQGEQTLCHEDRIMGMAAMQTATTAPFFCTASLDKTAKLWTLQENMVTGDNDDNAVTFSFQEKVHFQGHEARLCRTAFHPMQQHVATTSFDHTWRLWDMETAQCLLLQDGHWKQVFGIDFHPDGSLVATTDLASVVQLWDLRTGRAVHHFLGHAKRVLCASFSPNGFHLATAGDDGFVKVWDLRRRKPVVSIPAHSNLIAQVKFDSTTSDTLVSASFDGTAKVWSARDWKLLNTLQGHDGKVSGVDFVANHGLVTCGYDRTIKTWQ
eukprot:scaffold1943_cov160-Amphora_coffeaeformis.AAC.8